MTASSRLLFKFKLAISYCTVVMCKNTMSYTDENLIIRAIKLVQQLIPDLNLKG